MKHRVRNQEYQPTFDFDRVALHFKMHQLGQIGKAGSILKILDVVVIDC